MAAPAAAVLVLTLRTLLLAWPSGPTWRGARAPGPRLLRLRLRGGGAEPGMATAIDFQALLAEEKRRALESMRLGGPPVMAAEKPTSTADVHPRVVLTAKLAAAAAAAAAARGEQQERPPANRAASALAPFAVAISSDARHTAAKAATGAKAGRGTQLPEWWWWRQLQKQKEKDDEFARILVGRLGDDGSDEEPAPGANCSARNATRARNISTITGRVLSSGRVVVGEPGQQTYAADEGTLPPTELACSVRVKRLRKFSRLEKYAPLQDKKDPPTKLRVTSSVPSTPKAHPEALLAAAVSTAADGGGGSVGGDGQASTAAAGALSACANGTIDGRRKGVRRAPRKSSTPQVTKGLPRAMWEQVLHRGKCQYRDANQKQCTRKQPLFGSPREGQALYCKNHSKLLTNGKNESQHRNPLPMQDVKSPRCLFVGCSKHPIFGDAAVGVGIYCAQHRYAHHVDCVNRFCSHVEGCSRQAAYAFPSSRTPLFCLAHKEPEHINVRSPRCIHINDLTNVRCTRQRSFGVRGQPPLYCREHANASQHINVVSPTCRHVLGCSKIPSFGFPQEGQVLFCREHADLALHINLRYINLSATAHQPERSISAASIHNRRATRRCRHANCETRATFGDPNSCSAARRAVPVACKLHKEPHHIDLHNRLCQHRADHGVVCLRRATHGEPPPPVMPTHGEPPPPVMPTAHAQGGTAQQNALSSAKPARYPPFHTCVKENGGKKRGNGKEETLHGTKHNIHICVF